MRKRVLDSWGLTGDDRECRFPEVLGAEVIEPGTGATQGFETPVPPADVLRVTA